MRYRWRRTQVIKLAFLGCGRIIRKHAGILEARDDYELTALCDVSTEICETARDTHFPGTSPEIFTDARAMLAESSADAVVVMTPHTMHYEHASAVLESGRHVFIEKPMATSTEQARALAALAESRDRVVAVGYNTASTRAFHYLREQIRGGTFGRLELVCGYLSQNWMVATTGTWRQKPELSGGGQAYDSGAHILNSLLWSVESPPETVFALADFKDRPVDINSVLSVRFVNGVLGNITISGNCANSGRHMTFIFENGRVDIDGWVGEWINVFADGHPESPSLDGPESYPITNFLDAVNGTAEVAAGVTTGLNLCMLMDGIYESARSGNAVRTTAQA